MFTEVRLEPTLLATEPGLGCKVVKILLNSLLSRRPCSRAWLVKASIVWSTAAVVVPMLRSDLATGRGLSVGRVGYVTGTPPASSSSSDQASSASGSLTTNAKES